MSRIYSTSQVQKAKDFWKQTNDSVNDNSSSASKRNFSPASRKAKDAVFLKGVIGRNKDLFNGKASSEEKTELPPRKLSYTVNVEEKLARSRELFNGTGSHESSPEPGFSSKTARPSVASITLASPVSGRLTAARKANDHWKSSPSLNLLEKGSRREKPSFTRNLRDKTCVEGDRILFECDVKGSPTPRISWLKDGEDITSSQDYKMSFEDGVARLEISDAVLEDEGEFTCTATNSLGDAITACALMVEEKDEDMSGADERSDEEEVLEPEIVPKQRQDAESRSRWREEHDDWSTPNHDDRDSEVQNGGGGDEVDWGAKLGEARKHNGRATHQQREEEAESNTDLREQWIANRSRNRKQVAEVKEPEPEPEPEPEIEKTEVRSGGRKFNWMAKLSAKYSEDTNDDLFDTPVKSGKQSSAWSSDSKQEDTAHWKTTSSKLPQEDESEEVPTGRRRWRADRDVDEDKQQDNDSGNTNDDKPKKKKVPTATLR